MSERIPLYDRLPEVLRRSDAERGQPLRALVGVLERELDELRIDAETMWDDWFIETCEEWLVPYIGELLGVRGMRTGPEGTVPLRGFVANQLAYRRRKGTVAAVEELARDLAGRPARALEHFALCIRNPHIRHVRPQPGATVELGDVVALARIGSPFETFAHTPDVRHIRSGRGRYNLPNVGLFVWPHEVHVIEHGTAARHPIVAEAFAFDPLGRDAPLFGAPVTETSIESLATRAHVPRRLTRIDLWHEQQTGDGSDLASFAVRPRIPPPLPATQWRIEIANLAAAGGGLPIGRPAPDTIRVDPELGRILFHPSAAPAADEVEVDYGFASPWRIGAGPFDRSEAWRTRWAQLRTDVTFFRRVTLAALPAVAQAVASFATAIADWNAFVTALPPADAANAVGVIAIADSRTDSAAGLVVELPPGARLHVVALATGPAPGDSLDGDLAIGVRPVLAGDFAIHGHPAPGSQRLGGAFRLEGVLVGGSITIVPGELERLELEYCTLPHTHGGIDVQTGGAGTNAGLEVVLRRTQCGAMTSAAPGGTWNLADCIVHGSPFAIDASAVELAIVGSTVIGPTRCRILRASNTTFRDDVTVAQHQEGCLRYCYASLGSATPQRYRCQPDRALEGVTDPALRARIVARLRPEYESLDPIDPGYVWLDRGAAAELRTSGEQRSEIGAGHHLFWSIREANLRTALRQYFRFGLEAGLFTET